MELVQLLPSIAASGATVAELTLQILLHCYWTTHRRGINQKLHVPSTWIFNILGALLDFSILDNKKSYLLIKQRIEVVKLCFLNSSGDKVNCS